MFAQERAQDSHEEQESNLKTPPRQDDAFAQVRPKQDVQQSKLRSTVSSTSRSVVVEPLPDALHEAFDRPSAVDTAFNSSGKGGAALRSIGEHFGDNSANGTLSFSIPLPLSVGRSANDPSLSLSYDSGNGNGPFGFGWGLSVPYVSRKAKHRIPQYNDDTTAEDPDTFVVAGLGELVPTETLRDGDYLVKRYRPCVDTTYSRIERRVNLKNLNDVYWRIISSDNVTSIFGATDESRVSETCGDHERIFAWQLCHSYDSFGNAVRYRYKAEDAKGIPNQPIPSWEANRSEADRCRQRYIKSVQYGNKMPNRELDTWQMAEHPLEWMFEAVFDYGDHDLESPTSSPTQAWPVRKDPFSDRRPGFEIRTYRLCHRVLMFHHFSEQMGRSDVLVSSITFQYVESGMGTFLASMTKSGYTFNKTSTNTDEYIRDDLPALTFEYTKIPDLTQTDLKRIDTSNLYALPSTDSTRAEWIDLEGEGLPGLLVRSGDGTISYQRNAKLYANGGDIPMFASLTVLPSQPSLRLHDKTYFETLDGSGRKSLVAVFETGQIHGFSERSEGGQWNEFRPFKSTPTLNMLSKELLRLDLTGNGLLDILHAQVEPGCLEWQRTLGTGGYAEKLLTRSTCGSIELRSSGPYTSRSYLVDMTGDGLTDIALVQNGLVCYWPNLGYGRFGDKVSMGNSPKFDQGDQFTPSRLHLIDLDGSGTSDLLYIFPGGEVKVFYNLAGNEWSESTTIGNFPEINNLSTVCVLDLLGRGTGVLCWIDPGRNPTEVGTLHYLDIMGSQKPHLLTKYWNGSGKETTINYRPSTEYYLNDERQSNPWCTRLPFPVQCVSEVVVNDHITRSTRVTSYLYHEGCYDAEEREFCGFGMVEQHQQDYVSLGITEKFESAPKHTKTWFSTGAHMTIKPLEKAFRVPGISSKISAQVLSSDQPYACRALKGQVLRREIYSQDDSVKACNPYEVTECAYEVYQVQAPTTGRKGIFEVLLKEKLSTQYERDTNDPQIEHTIVLKRNAYGDIQSEAHIYYGRAPGASETENFRGIRKNQIETRIVCDEVLFTNAIDTVSEPADYLKPSPWSARQCEIRRNNITKLLDVDQLSGLGIQAPIDNRFSLLPDSTLISETRVYFRNAAMTRTLPKGQREALSVQEQGFRLCTVPGIVDKLFEEVAANIVQIPFKQFMASHGYQDLDRDSRWWAPLSKARYSILNDANAQLQAARRSYYRPTVFEDPRGNRDEIEFDVYKLLPVRKKDAVGNATELVHDYQRLRPVRLTDPNLNVQEVCYDGVGNVIATARPPKSSEDLGDSLEGMEHCDAAAAIAMVIDNPNGEVARALLGRAESRTILQLGCNAALSVHGDENFRPPSIVHLSRNAPYGTEDEVNIQVSIKYLDSDGLTIQTFELADWSDGAKQWRVTDCVLRTGGNVTLRSFQPFYVGDARYIPPTQISAPFTTHFSDALDRQIGEIRPNGTWTKVRHNPWSTTTFSAGDTVLNEDLASDSDVGSSFRAFKGLRAVPCWYSSRRNEGGVQQQAAMASEILHDTPTTSHRDSSKRDIALVILGGSTESVQQNRFDAWDNVVSKIDQTGRIAEQNHFDMLGRCLKYQGLDSSATITFYDCIGNAVLLSPSTGIWGRASYDEQNREVELWMKKRDAPFILTVKREYGESQEDAPKANLRGRLWRVYDHSGVSCNLEFDARGNCIRSSIQLAKSYSRILDWREPNELSPEVYFQHVSFNYSGQKTKVEDALGNKTRYTYSKCGNISTIERMQKVSTQPVQDGNQTKWQPYVSAVTYNANNLPLKTSYGNGTITQCIYDEYTSAILQEVIRGPDGVIDSRTHVYDCEGRLVHSTKTSDESHLFPNRTAGPDTSFRYDALGQLVSATGREQFGPDGLVISSMKSLTASNGLGTAHPLGEDVRMCEFLETYEYDLVGNIVSIKHEPRQESAISGWERKYFYAESSLIESARTNNRLSRTVQSDLTEEYKYEGRAGGMGCVTFIPGRIRLKYDCHGKLAASTTVPDEGNDTTETTYYTYNTDGVRVAKVTQRDTSSHNLHPYKLKETIYLPALELQLSYREDGTTVASSKYISNIQGISTVATIEGVAESAFPLVRYCYRNGIEMDAHADLISYEEYSPFGSCTYAARRVDVEDSRSHGFQNYMRDSETDFFYCEARYYAGWLGRWTTVDPLGSIDGLNLYRYCGNDPVNYTDPTGTFGHSGTPKGNAHVSPAQMDFKLSSWVSKPGIQSQTKAHLGYMHMQAAPQVTLTPDQAAKKHASLAALKAKEGQAKQQKEADDFKNKYVKGTPDPKKDTLHSYAERYIPDEGKFQGQANAIHESNFSSKQHKNYSFD